MKSVVLIGATANLHSCYSRDLGSAKADRVPVNLSLTEWDGGAGLVIQRKCATCHTEQRARFVPANTPRTIDQIGSASFFENRRNRNFIKDMLHRVGGDDDGSLAGANILGESESMPEAYSLRRGHGNEPGDDHGGHGHEPGDDHGGHGHEPGDDHGGHMPVPGDDHPGPAPIPGDDSAGRGQGSQPGQGESHHHEEEGVMPPKFATQLYPEEKEALIGFLKARLRAFATEAPPTGPSTPSTPSTPDTGGGGSLPPPSPSLKFADVEPIVLANCAKSGCHDGARRLFPLKTREDFFKRKPMPLDAINSGDMPVDNPDFKDSDDGKKLILYLLGPQTE